MRLKLFICILSICTLLTSCKVKEYIEVPVEVEKIKTEYVHQLDSIYLHDSISTYIIQKGDTVFIDRYKYKIKEVFRTDTVHQTDTIPKIVTLTKTVEVNKLRQWQIVLMWLVGVGVLGLILFILYKLKLWKLLF